VLIAASVMAGPAPAQAAGSRSVRYTWGDFFQTPGKRAPVTYVLPVVDGPSLFPGIGATRRRVAPAALDIEARNVQEISIDTIGGVDSPAPAGTRTGFLPYDLMGNLGSPPAGGQARLDVTVQYLTRDQSSDAGVAGVFGSHGWENEAAGTITLDRAGARKVLGLSDAEVAGFASFFAANEDRLEQRWRWWLYDEGGDQHVGGVGRLDVRPAFDTPLQMWVNDIDLVSATADRIELRWRWVNMAGDMLWSRWIHEGLGMGHEPNSFSRLRLDMTVGAGATDLDAEFVVDNALTKVPGADRWVFEPQLADLADLAAEYRNESTYLSPARDYADATDRSGSGYGRTPSAWDLGPDERLRFEYADLPGVRMNWWTLDPAPGAFPGQISRDGKATEFRGPIDFTASSLTRHAADWARLAGPEHPDGLLPWGQPLVTFVVKPLRSPSRFSDPKPPAPVPSVDPGRAIPAFPSPELGATPPMPSTGRTVRFDLYRFLDVPMPADRWEQLEDNGYVKVDRASFPVEYRTEGTTYSGFRLRATGRNLPEIGLDDVGGGLGKAGFLPSNLMGGLEAGVTGGTATFDGHLAYGERPRESVYRLPEWWGYYGWENFLDARITLDRSAARRVLGISGTDADAFAVWFAANERELETSWRQWLYREFRRSGAMAFFDFPLTIWALDLELVSASSGRIELRMTVFNEALEVLYGRWFNETFLPGYESSIDDMHLSMRIGPTSADLDLDLATGWSLYQDGKGRWVFEPSLGDDPALADEYRITSSPGLPYLGATLDSYQYDYTPSAWNLRSGEQLNLHVGSAGLIVDTVEPGSGAFRGQIDATSSRVSLTGPMDLRAWSRTSNANAWQQTGGLLPWGEPYITFR